ncbi:uncharacterized protein J7T54_007018 [Emericellopsis cladophorae]|uniref:Uncharacterized protein n=1 Tax=Emericellopsis cladophorae TaxID=2686198 RepID=A0A9Q0BHQ9_9HYPO|nr:uncharacterized protein J7T54_007018 [Emericellopsis cladophorae]KAI6785376.1 hypothetical protein J7T54_007018 [Emericellopsis cladophorae]
MNGSEIQYHSENLPHDLARFVPSGSTALTPMTSDQLRRLSIAVDEVEAFLREQRNDHGSSSDCSECGREALRDHIPGDEFLRAYPIYRPRVPLTQASLAEHNNGFRMFYVPHPRVDESASPPAPPASPEPTATPEPSASPAPLGSAQDGDEDDEYPDSVTIAATSDSTCCDMCSESSIERRRATQREQRIQQQERRRERADRRHERVQRLRRLGGLPVGGLQ